MTESDSHPDPDIFLPTHRCGVLLPAAFAQVYDYQVADGMVLKAGDFVRVPFGPRKLVGVVWGPGTGPEQGGVADARLKTVLEKLPVAAMTAVTRKFIDWVAGYTLSSPGGVLKMAISVPDALDPPKAIKAFRIADPVPDIKWTAPRTRVLAVLKDHAPLSAAAAARRAGCSPAVVNGLVKAGALVAVNHTPRFACPQPDGDYVGPDLSTAQRRAADDLVAKTRARAYAAVLLDGVPGSGKTEVYFEAVAQALKQGQQVLVLLPEIALGSQWLARFERRFGVAPAQWHSDLGQRVRRETWRAVARNETRVVVGARSALFLPFQDLGLIVVDEEHDGAFKQEEGVIYNARDMAVVRAHLGQIPICLASATPSLESLVNADTGKYTRAHLPERHGGAVLPDLDLIDMRREKLPATKWLSGALQEALTRTFAAGEQAMLFLNRRGYAPLTLCRTCGFRLACPNCSAWLVEHRVRGRLQCHHCGHAIQMPKTCPDCAAEHSFHACGPGVERVAEEARACFPDVRTVVASSDTLSSPQAAAELIESIEAHRVDLIIGTQIVAKGYHFPMLTLVGVVDGDLGLAGGDLRAAERTYQLLYQVAGRAGRSKRAGRVLVQTYQPDHAVMQAMKSGRREDFIEAEICARKDLRMPPFGRLVAVIVSGVDEALVHAQANTLIRCAPHRDGVEVLGPAPAPLAVLRGRYRWRLLVKLKPGIAPQPLVRAWLQRSVQGGKRARGVRIQIDVDPQSFL